MQPTKLCGKELISLGTLKYSALAGQTNYPYQNDTEKGTLLMGPF